MQKFWIYLSYRRRQARSDEQKAFEKFSNELDTIIEDKYGSQFPVKLRKKLTPEQLLELGDDSASVINVIKGSDGLYELK